MWCVGDTHDDIVSVVWASAGWAAARTLPASAARTNLLTFDMVSSNRGATIRCRRGVDNHLGLAIPGVDRGGHGEGGRAPSGTCGGSALPAKTPPRRDL